MPQFNEVLDGIDIEITPEMIQLMWVIGNKAANYIIAEAEKQGKRVTKEQALDMFAATVAKNAATRRRYNAVFADFMAATAGE